MTGVRVKKIGLRTLLRRIAIGYLIVWVLSPVMAYGTEWRMLAAGAAGVWLLLELTVARSILLRPNRVVLLAAAYALYTLGVDTLAPTTPDPLRQIQVWIMLFFLLVGESLQRGREDDLRFYFWLVLVILPVWEVATLGGLAVDAHAARAVVRSSTEAIELAADGVGGFALVYSVLLSLPFTIWLSLRPGALRHARSVVARRLAHLLFVCNAVLGSLLVLRAGYSIAVILMFMVVACVLLVRSRKRFPFAISMVAAALLAAVGWFSLNPVLSVVQESVAGTAYAVKVRDVRISLSESNSVGTVDDRMSRYTRSFRLFMEHPFLGVLVIDDVGKHSAILDRFAQYGVIVGGLFLYLICYIPWRVLRDHRVPLGMGLAFFVAAFGFPMLNNVFMSWGVVLYIFARGACVVMGLPLGARVQRVLSPGKGTMAHA